MRKLATIRFIDKLLPIEGADKIELAVVDGWQVVVKKNEHKQGSPVVYLEVDSWVPHTLAPFLTREGSEPKEYKGVKGQRLKTIKLRGQISQGLILPFDVLILQRGKFFGIPDVDIGEDVSELLGIIKWEREFNQGSFNAASKPKGNFPALVPKTDQERVQNLSRVWEKYQDPELTWEVTEKLEGSSCTFYLSKEGEFEVCSRNLSLKENDDCKYWQVAKLYNVEQNMRENELYGFAIQGELVGEKIQGNIYGLAGVDFYIYDIYDTNRSAYVNAYNRKLMRIDLGLKHVPEIVLPFRLNCVTISDIISYADGKSVLNIMQDREGIVFKCNEKPELSFKAISNKYLLKEKD